MELNHTVLCGVGRLLLGVVCAAGWAGCRGRGEVSETREFLAMGTVASVRAGAAETRPVAEFEAVMRSTFAADEARLSIYRPESEISRLNQAGTNPVAISAETRAILAQALRVAELSGGAFDPTIGPLVRAWGFSGGRVPTAPPDAETLAAARDRVGYRFLHLEKDRASARIPGLFVDLGGIAKGYAVDGAWEQIAGRGGQHVLINLGGNMRVLGEAAPGRPWRVGVRDPFDGERIVGVMKLAPGQALATSGNYERFVTLAGRRYAHIIDPRTGRPVEGMAGVTVRAPTATAADAWSTILFILGVEDGRAALADQKEIDAAWIPDREPREIWMTPDWARDFEPLPEWRAAVRILGEKRPSP